MAACAGDRAELGQRLEPFCQASTAGSQGINSLADFRAGDKRRSVVRLQPSVDRQRTGASPVFLLDERIHSVDIRRRVGSRERHPQEIGQRPRCEITVVNDDDERKAS